MLLVVLISARPINVPDDIMQQQPQSAIYSFMYAMLTRYAGMLTLRRQIKLIEDLNQTLEFLSASKTSIFIKNKPKNKLNSIVIVN